MVYKHAYLLNTLLLLHSTFMLPLKEEVEGHASNSHGNYIVDQGFSRKNTWGGALFLPNHPWNSISSDTNHPCNQKVSYTNYP